MPQLMPLNWMFSSMMILVILVSAGVVYGENMELSKINDSMSDINKSVNYWCW